MEQRPYWLSQALATDDGGLAPALASDTRAQLCIIGGGASGRNGGCALTWSTKFFTLQRLFGDAEAVRLVRASEQALLDIEAFCAEHNIDCEWRRHGTLFTATSQAQPGASDAVVAALEAHGINSWQKIPPHELQRRAGSRAPLGRFPPEPIRYVGSLMVRNAIRRKEAAEGSGRRPFLPDMMASRFAAAAGKADKA